MRILQRLQPTDLHEFLRESVVYETTIEKNKQKKVYIRFTLLEYIGERYLCGKIGYYSQHSSY
jgi:hypothetical protein